MKLNNDFLVLDLETTAGQDENGFQTNNDIIQIGAVLLDRNLDPIAEFESLVKPREIVSEFVTNLTGISNKEAQSAKEFIEVSNNLQRLVESKVKNIKQVRICAWGTYFDLPIIRRLYKEYGLQFPYSGTGFDIKTLAMLWMSLSDRRTDKLSVGHLAEIMGYTPKEAFHNALIDSRVEAKILKRIIFDLDKGTFFNGQLIKLFSSEL